MKAVHPGSGKRRKRIKKIKIEIFSFKVVNWFSR
jgi:hypothetical protein